MLGKEVILDIYELPLLVYPRSWSATLIQLLKSKHFLPFERVASITMIVYPAIWGAAIDLLISVPLLGRQPGFGTFSYVEVSK